MSSQIVLASTSLAEDGAFRAMADVAGAASGTGTDYRVTCARTGSGVGRVG